MKRRSSLDQESAPKKATPSHLTVKEYNDGLAMPRIGILDACDMEHPTEGGGTVSTSYSGGIRNGVQIVRDSKDSIVRQSHYKDGELHGPHTQMDSSGKFITTIQFSHGMQNGLTLRWDYWTNGSRCISEHWVADKQHGLTIVSDTREDIKYLYYRHGQKVTDYDVDLERAKMTFILLCLRRKFGRDVYPMIVVTVKVTSWLFVRAKGTF